MTRVLFFIVSLFIMAVVWLGLCIYAAGGIAHYIGIRWLIWIFTAVFVLSRSALLPAVIAAASAWHFGLDWISVVIMGLSSVFFMSQAFARNWYTPSYIRRLIRYPQICIFKAGLITEEQENQIIAECDLREGRMPPGDLSTPQETYMAGSAHSVPSGLAPGEVPKSNAAERSIVTILAIIAFIAGFIVVGRPEYYTNKAMQKEFKEAFETALSPYLTENEVEPPRTELESVAAGVKAEKEAEDRKAAERSEFEKTVRERKSASASATKEGNKSAGDVYVKTKDALYDYLDQHVPEWEEQNSDPDFLVWLTYNGRQERLNTAFADLNAGQVSLMFREFRNAPPKDVIVKNTDDLYRYLDLKVPGWEVQNKDPEYLEWLERNDKLKIILEESFKTRNAGRVAKIFIRYRKETGKTYGQ